MTSLFDKLNLNAQERRLVVITVIVVIALLNWFFVFPEFGEYGRNLNRIDASRQQLKKYKDEIAKRPAYQKEMDSLKTQAGSVPTEQAALRLQDEVHTQAALSQVTITGITPLIRQGAGGKTNAFFEEAALTVNINTGEKELIDFLYRLADKELLIRARGMNINPDQGRHRLQGQLTLVKSYQRRPPASKVTASATASKPAAEPAKPAATTPGPAAPRNEPTVKPTPKPTTPAAPVSTPPPATSGTNRVRRMPSAVKP
jgi:Tfp pilus assembly protein PilO